MTRAGACGQGDAAEACGQGDAAEAWGDALLAPFMP